MALTKLEAEIDQNREAAQSAIRQFQHTATATRADTNLSDAGKQKLIADAYLLTKEALHQHRTAENAVISTTRTTLERKLFGQTSTDPSSIIAYRDAQDRVRAIEPGGEAQALDMLRTARLSGDTTLAAALVARATEAGWREVIDAYKNDNPSGAADLQDLARLNGWTESWQMQVEATFAYDLAKPKELERYSDHSLRELVNGTSESRYTSSGGW